MSVKTKTLIAYATNSGNTFYTGQRIADILSGENFDVTISPVAKLSADDVKLYDFIILGCPSWDNMVDGKKMEGQMQHEMEIFTAKFNGRSFEDKKFAVFSLGNSDYTYVCGSGMHLDKFVEKIKGQKVGETLCVDNFPHQLQARIDDWAKSLTNNFS
jgi:flavodoxin